MFGLAGSIYIYRERYKTGRWVRLVYAGCPDEGGSGLSRTSLAARGKGSGNMRRHPAGDILLKALGLLLLTAAVLKGHELLTVPVANGGLWMWRPFLIFQVEFELALGFWLLSGVFKRLAWLATLLCFGLFCCVTLYKALTGAASCGCFGTVHVNPWLTLLAIDLPAVVALTLFRPYLVIAPILSFLRR